MHQQLLECVPNFSEGRDLAVIRRITDRIEAVDGVTLLDVDPGKATNRTVVTFVGAPGAVVQAAFEAVRQASELIDMRRHHGEHPRFGATDVCPLVPVANITMEATVAHARALAERLGEELGLTIFCYEQAALRESRRDLAVVREGEYEALADRLALPEWQPDFGPAAFNARSGATAVGAREFLVAYNVNLNTTSTRRANAIAFDVREKGRVRRAGDPLTGDVVRDADGEPVWTPGTLPSVKAIGWYIEEYGIAQISMNLTNLAVTPIHVAFDEVCARAGERGIRVTGSELVGLVPLRSMLQAGRYFLEKQRRSLGVPDAELITIAVKSLGLDDLGPFDPNAKIIEYAIADRTPRRLVDLALGRFVSETASESAAPGGGSVAAAVGALGAALGTMVANLAAHKRGWDDRWREFSDWAERGKGSYTELQALIDEDTVAFNRVLAAFKLPAGTAGERAARDAEVAGATREAIDVPLRVMEAALRSMDVIREMAEIGLKSSASDAGVGALCARAAIRGAYLNVRTNAAGLKDAAYVARVIARGAEWEAAAEEQERAILEIVARRM
ncbi:MAG TPA: glutamate formimidoyltransferase [Gemmatimonadales bacterium]